MSTKLTIDLITTALLVWSDAYADLLLFNIQPLAGVLLGAMNTMLDRWVSHVQATDDTSIGRRALSIHRIEVASNWVLIIVFLGLLLCITQAYFVLVERWNQVLPLWKSRSD